MGGNAASHATSWRELFEQGDDAMLILEPREERVLDANLRACELYGFTRSEFVGRSMRTLSAYPSRGRGEAVRLFAVEPGVTHSFQTTQFRKDGSPLALEVRCLRMNHHGNDAILSVNRPLPAPPAAGVGVGASFTQIAAAVAHDIRHLLGIIDLRAALLERDGGESASAPESLVEIRAAVAQAAALAREFSMIAAHTDRPARPLDLDALVDSMRARLALLANAESAAVDFVVRLGSAPGLAVCDAGRVERVLLNLIANAAHAMQPAGGSLTIETSALSLSSADGVLDAGRYVRLRVEDTGHGMDAATCARVFEPLFTTKAPGRGTGLGLASCRALVRGDRGDVRVRSEVRCGTTLDVFWPSHPAP